MAIFVKIVSTPVLIWWVALGMVSVLNALAWARSARDVVARKSSTDPELYVAIRRQLLLSAIFVVVCGFRSFVPRADVQKICLVDSWISSVFVGRSVATIAELAFVAQCALLLGAFADRAGVRFASAVARVIVPAIAVAETCSWYAVLTTCYAGNIAEESIWALTAALITVALLALRSRSGALKPFLTAAIVCAAAYVAFMATVDVPMYISRFRADELAGRQYLSLADGLRAAATQWTVTGSIAAWREEIPWMSLYFSVMVWVSIGLIHLPRVGAVARLGPEPGLRPQALEPRLV
jgi:hypothetical protein